MPEVCDDIEEIADDPMSQTGNTDCLLLILNKSEHHVKNSLERCLKPATWCCLILVYNGDSPQLLDEKNHQYVEIRISSFSTKFNQ